MMTVAKRDGRTGMAASLGGDTPAITARSLRHSTRRKWPKSSLGAPGPRNDDVTFKLRHYQDTVRLEQRGGFQYVGATLEEVMGTEADRRRDGHPPFRRFTQIPAFCSRRCPLFVFGPRLGLGLVKF